MEVCCREALAIPMTDQGELSDDEKRHSIDPIPIVDNMELKVATGANQAQVDLSDGGCQAGAPGSNMGPEPVIHSPHGDLNGHLSENTTGKSDSVYDFDPDTEGEMPPNTLEDSSEASPDKHSDRSDVSDSVKNEPELETLDDSEMAEDESVTESYDGQDYPLETEESVSDSFEGIPRRGRGRPRGSKNRVDGRGRGRGLKFRRLSEDRTCTAYDLRNIPDPFANQRRGRPRSRFIVDLGEQNHEAWTKSKEELNISDAELTTLLLSLLESRRECNNTADSDTMLGLITSEYNKWKDKFTSQVSMLSHYASIHNTNCCTCLGIKKKKYIPAGTGKRGRPRKYPPPVGCEYRNSDGPGMQRPDTIDEDGNIFEPQIILKDGMVVKNEPGNERKGLQAGENGAHDLANTSNGNSGIQILPRPILSKEELEKRREYYNNHKNKIKYVCHYCQVHFYHKPNFDFHISKLESTGKCKIYEKLNNLYLCESCGEGFSWREKLEKHLRLAEQHGTHNQKELLMFGDFQCNMCGKTFNKRTTYVQHIKWHEDREDIPCVICGTMFKQIDLRHHLMEVHSNDSLPCCYCGKLFTSRKYLEKHELVHQGGNFPCPECGKTFSQKSNMQQHLKTHSLDKEYSCEHGASAAGSLAENSETEITVFNEIDKLDVQKSLIQEWRSDLQMICKELEFNTGTTSKNIKYSIEAVADSIRHRKNLIATHHKNECDRKKLQGFIKTYNSENSETLSEKDAIEGILPWHNLLPHHSKNVSLAQKKKAVEDVELQKRSREEQQHTIQEMLHYLTYYKKKREILTEHTKEFMWNFPFRSKQAVEEVYWHLRENSKVFKSVPNGPKEDTFYVVDNSHNLTKGTKTRSSFPDDCGVWNSARGKTQWVPLEPQPSPDTLITMHRYYTVLKGRESFKKRVIVIKELESVGIVEYSGKQTGETMHGNSQKNIPYVRTRPEVLENIGKMVKIQPPREVYQNMLMEELCLAPRDFQQPLNGI
ncbi:uncharacterized protein [Procambarus clarkii]|uniref:uncharacterized protein n=1 Tax=Procambarus clarkii TaxID=6728 RepID=UPI0037447C68